MGWKRLFQHAGRRHLKDPYTPSIPLRSTKTGIGTQWKLTIQSVVKDFEQWEMVSVLRVVACRVLSGFAPTVCSPVFWVKGNDSLQIYAYGTQRTEEANFWALVPTCNKYSRVLPWGLNLQGSLKHCAVGPVPQCCGLSVKPAFSPFQPSCCFPFIPWIKGLLRGSNYIMEKRTQSSENI